MPDVQEGSGMTLAGSRPEASLSVGGMAASGGVRLVLAVIGVLLLLRLVLAATSNLSEDEAYYWLWSTSLAAGYYDHPPMVAYWIRAGTAIFGDTAFGVRFVGFLSALGSSYLLYRASLSLFRDAQAALLCVLWLNATLLCNAAAIVATPDTPLAFFATLTLFALARLIETGRGAWWLGVGVALGLAFMSKYTAALLLPGVFIWLLATAEGRRWFARPEPYAGAAIAAAVAAPVFWWNYAHDWASFAKQAHHSVSDKPASAIASIGELLGGQAGLATPLIFAFCVFGSFFALRRGWKKRDARWLLLGGAAAPVLVFFLVHSASHRIQANWPGFVYPAAILAGVHGFLALSRERAVAEWTRTAFRLAPWLGAAVTLVAFLQLGLGVVPIEAGKDPTARLKGWEKLGADVSAIADAQGAASILTNRYASTGELAFYGSKRRPVYQLNERIRYTNLPAPDEVLLGSGPALLVLRHGTPVRAAGEFYENSRFVTTIQREAGFHPSDAYDLYLLLGYRGGLSGQETSHSCETRPNGGTACN
jgi:4-amino-4-deoxy-L-arabinose transferase-like glycosyltransferase